jgi:hypothetical protein
MNYIVTLSSKEFDKPRRFVNSISEEWISFETLPKNCTLIKEGDDINIADIGIINDGFIPLMFNVETTSLGSTVVHPFDYKSSLAEANKAVATMLIVSGYCLRATLEKPTNQLAIRHNSLNERLENMQHLSDIHAKGLSNFLQKEKRRINFFDFPPWFYSEIESLKASKKRIMEAVDDIYGLLEARERLALDAIAKQVNP